MPQRASRLNHGFATLTAGATLFLIVAGGLVTSTGSGLAVPDWPLSYGELFPPMVGGIFYEHGHRMVAGAVGLLTLALALWLQFREPRRWVRRLAWLALAAVIAQAVLGGITVLYLLPTAVSVAHACLAQVFFCLTVTLAAVTSRWWIEGSRAPETPASGGRLRALGILATGTVFVQLALGALMRHMGAGMAIPDFPLSFGRLVPPLANAGIAVNFAHRAWSLVVAAAAGWLVLRVLRAHRDRGVLVRPALLLAAALAAQFVLAAFTVWTGRGVVPATAHVANGALILGVCLSLTLRAGRCLAPQAPLRRWSGEPAAAGGEVA